MNIIRWNTVYSALQSGFEVDKSEEEYIAEEFLKYKKSSNLLASTSKYTHKYTLVIFSYINVLIQEIYIQITFALPEGSKKATISLPENKVLIKKFILMWNSPEK